MQRDSAAFLYKIGLEITSKSYARIDSQTLKITDLTTGNTVYQKRLTRPTFVRRFLGDEDSLDLKVQLFSDYFTFPHIGYYRLEWTGLNRPISVKNQGVGIGYLENLLFVDSSSNHMPFFKTVGNHQAFLGKTYMHAPFPEDIDRDSLVFSVQAPWSDNQVPLSRFTLPPSSVAFGVDSYTSFINWKPTALGLYGFVFVVSEFKNGQLRSTQMKEYVVSVKQTEVDSFQISPYFGLNASLYSSTGRFPLTHPVIMMTASTIDLEILTGEIIDSSRYTNISKSLVWNTRGSYTFSCDLKPTARRAKPYVVCFTSQAIRGGVISSVDYPVKLYFTSPTEVNTVESVFLRAYPNPTTDVLNVEIPQLQAGTIHIEWISVSGQLLSTQLQTHQGGDFRITLTSLPSSGVYFLRVVCGDGKQYLHKVIVE